MRKCGCCFFSAIRWIAPLAAGYVLLIVLSSPWWLGPLLSPQFAEHWSTLAAYLCVVGVAVLFTPLHQLIYALGYVRFPAALTLVAVGVFITLCVVLAPSLELLGFVIAFAAYNLLTLGAKSLLLLFRRRRAVAAASVGPA